MANFDEMWTIIGKYPFTVDDQFSVYVSCIICNKLLIDAHSGKCGCKYCKHCIAKYLGDGGLFCPGGSDDCATRELSLQTNIGKDAGANRNVSNIKVKCPSISCDHHCILVLMSHHLLLCDKREMCPFSEMGCTVESLDNVEMSEHVSTEVHHHNKLMIGRMSNMINDMARKNQDNLINLEQSMELKMSEVTGTLQLGMRDLVEKNDRLTTRLDRQDEEITKLREAEDKQSNRFHQLQGQMDLLEAGLVDRIDKLGKACVAELSFPVATSQASSIVQSKQIKKNPKQPIKTVASFVWKTIYLPHSKSEILSSSQFVSIDNEYRMHLTNRNDEAGGILITFHVGLAPREILPASWSCQFTVTMAIFNPSSENVRQSKSQNCHFDPTQSSITFEFSLDEIIKAGVTSQFLMQCIASSSRTASSLMTVVCVVGQ